MRRAIRRLSAARELHLSAVRELHLNAVRELHLNAAREFQLSARLAPLSAAREFTHYVRYVYETAR